MAEVLLDTLSGATGASTDFKNYPKGWRALQLPDSNIDSYFLKSFGRPDREKTCECERTAEPNVTQVLHISNGNTLNQKLGSKDNFIGQWLKEMATPEQMVERAYLTALSRFPTKAEKEKMTAVIIQAQTSDKEKRAALEDIYWALLSSKEFLFNH
jgi:hypothetical protein